MESSDNRTACDPLEVSGLTLAFDDFVLLREVDFSVRAGEIFILMGGSGCGKSTLLRHLLGLDRSPVGSIRYKGVDLWEASEEQHQKILRSCGVLYQQGALWSSMTLAENVALPLEEFTNWSKREIRQVACLKLALVGLRGFEDYIPSEISGGMRKRAALARAMALDPEILFLDEPSAGLDPVTSRNLDDLILRLRDALGCTVVLVTHELSSIFAVGDRALFLDNQARQIGGLGSPKELRDHPPSDAVRAFLNPREDLKDENQPGEA